MWPFKPKIPQPHCWHKIDGWANEVVGKEQERCCYCGLVRHEIAPKYEQEHGEWAPDSDKKVNDHLMEPCKKRRE